MDTNSNNKKVIHASILTILLLILFSTIAVIGYGPAREHVHPDDDFASYVGSREFANDLGRYTSFLINTGSSSRIYSNFNDVKSIKYHIINTETQYTMSNIPNVTSKVLQGEKGNSAQYIVVSFNEEGIPSIEGNTEMHLREYARSTERNGDELEYANHEITFIIPSDFHTYNDIFSRNMKVHSIFNYHWKVILAIALINLAVVIIAAMAIPYSYQSKVGLHKVYNSIFDEIKALLFLFFAGVVFFLFFLYSGGFSEIEIVVNTLYKPDTTFYIFSILIAFIVNLQVYLTVVYLKSIFYLGIYKGFVLNSICGRTIVIVYKKIKMLINNILEIDVTSDYHKMLLKVMIINLIVLWFIMISGFLGFIIALVYTVYLFNYLTKLFKIIKDIHVASEKIATGNFDITLNEEDAGIFKPISRNLNNIKEGFELAVNEETKSQKLKAELITNVSHDLKTPLTSIITYIDLLKEEQSQEKRAEYIEIIERKSKRLNILIEDLFEASKASSGNIELQLENVDAFALFRQTMGELEEKINESSLKFKVNLPEEKAICNLDGKRTYRVFENIMSNILKYSLESSRVYIDAQETQNMVNFTFKNISSYEMNFDTTEITERFSRGDKSRNTEGSGLGLAIAKDLVELQNGNLTVLVDGDLFKVVVSFRKAE